MTETAEKLPQSGEKTSDSDIPEKNIENILDDTVADMATVQDHAVREMGANDAPIETHSLPIDKANPLATIQAETKPVKQKPASKWKNKYGKPLVDSQGRAPDSDMHVFRNGKPEESVKGFLKLRPGLKGKRDFKDPAETQRREKVDIIAQLTREEIAQANAYQLTTFTFAASTLIGGPEWEPRSHAESGYSEEKQMYKAWYAYFYQKDYPPLPPLLQVGAVFTMYAAPRLKEPVTQSRIIKAVNWVKEKVFRMKIQNVSQSNSGNDGKRENNAGDTASASVQAGRA